jgi:hypothetical protein
MVLLIDLYEDDAKSLRLKNDLERNFAAAVFLIEAPSPPLLGLGIV